MRDEIGRAIRMKKVMLFLEIFAGAIIWFFVRWLQFYNWRFYSKHKIKK